MNSKVYTLKKNERLCSKTIIDKLFSGGNKSLPVYPLRIVYMPLEEEHDTTLSVLISVPKKKFKRAVKRNLVKRQIREAYRKNKFILKDILDKENKKAAIAFIWIGNEICNSYDIENKVIKLLQLTAEKLL